MVFRKKKFNIGHGWLANMLVAVLTAPPRDKVSIPHANSMHCGYWGVSEISIENGHLESGRISLHDSSSPDSTVLGFI